jgi:hypothetical protein
MNRNHLFLVSCVMIATAVPLFAQTPGAQIPPPTPPFIQPEPEYDSWIMTVIPKSGQQSTPKPTAQPAGSPQQRPNSLLK